ncbi:site-specific integrase [Methylocystis echinoides]|uniref:tyrosine-type recombinase/integrase n=1 Tax=Methylocystis echinoides TaxID=29468 RepID=UPI0034313767
MATFTKRGNRWKAQIRRAGFPSLSKSFLSKSDAEKWARDKERSIDRGELPTNHNELKATTLGDLLTRYLEQITPTKRGSNSEAYRLRTMFEHPIAALSLKNLSPAAVASYRDDRLQKVSTGSVRRELAILSHCLEIAKREWGIALKVNPCAEVSKPSNGKARTRRLEAGEFETLDEALRQCGNPLVRHVFLFALATGMRRGEVIALRWEHVDLEQRTAHLPLTKNGDARTVPLSPAALQVLSQLPRQPGGPVFPISGNAVRLAWGRVKARVGIQDLRFHDLRREAISRFFEVGLSVPEVAVCSGHKDTRMLAVYTKLKAQDIAAKL